MKTASKFTDTHCHLEMYAAPERQEVIERALAAGVDRLITVGTTLAMSRESLKIAESNQSIFAAVGIHPHEAKDFDPETEKSIRELARKKKVVAIGETGLDYHYMHSPVEKQKDVFRRHLDMAMEAGLPVIVHSREADDDTMAILRASGAGRGVMHCFSGNLDMMREALSIGFHISIAGPVTFKKSSALKEVAAAIPDERFLLETDSPYLSPEPFRGKRNEPAHILNTARIVAELRGISLEDLARMTSLNAARLFGLPGTEAQAASGEITYRIRDSLYLNITNRCSNACGFCIRYQSDTVKGHILKLSSEPDAALIEKEIGDPKAFKEIVFCGFGEPTIRLDVIKEVSAWVKERGGRIRLNTNGHGNIINKRDILPELKGLVDSVSISLDAHDSATYQKLCRPAFPDAFEAVLDFIKKSKGAIPNVQATVVDAEGVDLEECRRLADNLGVSLRVRKLDWVG